MCLDTLASTDSLYMHVSKPPKENSPASLFFKELRSVGQRSANVSVEGVHKKINLAEDLLAWEHERFSIRRLSAFTLSSLRSHKDLSRGTIVDAASAVRCELVERNARVIAETLASYVYDLPGGEIFGGSLVSTQYLNAVWMRLFETGTVCRKWKGRTSRSGSSIWAARRGPRSCSARKIIPSSARSRRSSTDS